MSDNDLLFIYRVVRWDGSERRIRAIPPRLLVLLEQTEGTQAALLLTKLSERDRGITLWAVSQWSQWYEAWVIFDETDGQYPDRTDGD